jgi:hypothetical protein
MFGTTISFLRSQRFRRARWLPRTAKRLPGCCTCGALLAARHVRGARCRVLSALASILQGHARTFSAAVSSTTRAALKASTYSLHRRRSLLNAPACGHRSASTPFNGNDATPRPCAGPSPECTSQGLNETCDSSGPLSTAPPLAGAPPAMELAVVAGPAVGAGEAGRARGRRSRCASGAQGQHSSPSAVSFPDGAADAECQRNAPPLCAK